MPNEPTIEQQIEDIQAKFQRVGYSPDDLSPDIFALVSRLAADVRELQQALPAATAKVVVRGSWHPLTESDLETGVKTMDEYVRLQKLSNRQLVEEATNSDAADYMIVSEMMSRLDPDWSKENRPPEHAKPDEQRIPDPSGLDGPFGEHGQRPPGTSGVTGMIDGDLAEKELGPLPSRIAKCLNCGKPSGIGNLFCSTCAGVYPSDTLPPPPAPAETPEPTVDLVKKIISNAMAVVAHWNEFGPERCFEEYVARLEKLLKEYRLGQSQQPSPDAKPVKTDWARETMDMINKLTPGIRDKAFDPGWFLCGEGED